MLNIDELIKDSMKSGNKIALQAYKNIKSQIQLVKTAKNAKSYDEAVEIGILSKYAKKLEDAISEFSKAHRGDLISEYTSELEVVRKLLPEPITERELKIYVADYCLKNNFIERQLNGIKFIKIPKKEMGNAIKYIKSKFPQADDKIISNIVKEYVL